MDTTERTRVPAPEWLAAHAAKFAASGAAAAAARTAATVILLRAAPGGFEAYTQRRAATMAFAPGMYAFPGGSVDPRDASDIAAWAGPPPAWWGERLGLAPPQARAVVCAAVREVFEECGVLLAGPTGTTVIGDVSAPRWTADRQALLSREVSLVQLLANRGLVLRSDLLAPWARWLTPEFEPRRFDTYFFLAALPPQQAPADPGGESDQAVWVRPGATGDLPMLPPTRHSLQALAQYDSIEAALAASAACELTQPIRPRIEVDADGTWLRLDRSP